MYNRRYSKYKPSGVEWLGNVPEHWEVKPMICAVSERYETNDGMKESNLLSLSYGHIVEKDITSNDGLLPESFETYQIVRPGDIVFRLTDLQNDKRSLRSAIVREMGIITSAYLSVFSKGPDPEFLSYLFRAYDVTKVFYSMGGGLRQSMKFADLKRMPVLFPPLPEQKQIAAFLDRETAKIDALIAEQRRLLELLKEKRQAVISHAVTRGLDPKVRLKPSGIEWVGDVPEHWETRKLSQSFSLIGSGTTPRSDAIEYYDEGVIPWVNTGDLNDGKLSDCEKRVTPLAMSECSSLRLYPEGSLVVAMYGATIGKLSILQFEATVNQACCVFSGGIRVSIWFMFYWLLAFRQQIISLATGGGQPNISQEILRLIRFSCPPLSEQSGIICYLDAEAARFDALTAEAERVIVLLQERRTALISAAVTGQIKVG